MYAKVNHSVRIFDSILDYRLTCKRNGQPKYAIRQNLLDIDFLAEHTKENWYVAFFNNFFFELNI